MKLQQPIDIALVGTGFRSQIVYRLEGELAFEAQVLAAFKARTGIDPLDVEGMLDYTVSRV